jgi:hypothetical protein
VSLFSYYVELNVIKYRKEPIEKLANGYFEENQIYDVINVIVHDKVKST